MADRALLHIALHFSSFVKDNPQPFLCMQVLQGDIFLLFGVFKCGFMA